MPNRHFVAACVLGVFLAPSPAMALLCGIPLNPVQVSATAMAFGNYSPGSNAQTSATITVSCPIPVDLLPNFTITLSGGSSANPAARTMKRSGVPLNYNIYTAAAQGAPVWGDGSNGTVSQSYNGVLLQLGSVVYTAYGKLPSGQFVAPGAYTDTIIVTVSY